MSRSNALTVGLAVGSVLIAIGTLLQWIDDLKPNVLALVELAFAFMLNLAYPVKTHTRYMLGASSRRNKAPHRSAPLHHRRCRATSGKR